MTRLLAGLVALATAAFALTGAAAAQAKGDAAKGEALFKTRCAACHVVAPGAKPTAAPNLRGVVGRKAGVSDYVAYSKALPASALTWSTANLDKFLTAPATLIPGTFMVISVPKPDERAALIAYLGTLK